MILNEIVSRISDVSDEEVILVSRPWCPQSRANTTKLDADFKVPALMLESGLEYFLEISVAKEVLEVFGKHIPTIDESCSLLIYYAENDGYPDWVYEINSR